MTSPLSSSTGLIESNVASNQFNSMDSIALITKQLVARAKEERAEVAVDFDRGDFIRATQKIERLTRFKEKIANNVATVTKAKGAVTEIKNTLLSAKSKLQTMIGSTSAETRQQISKDYNDLIKKISTVVDGATQNFGFRSVNLVGNFEGSLPENNKLLIPTRETGGGALQFEGMDLGANFKIIDGGGFTWKLDKIDNKFYQHTVVNDLITKTGLSISADDLNVSSYDPNSGSITLAGSQPLSGTLVRSGLNILTSEYHQNFSDDTLVQRAINDLETAITKLDIDTPPLVTKAKRLEKSLEGIDLRIKILEKEKDTIRQEELDASRAVSLAADMKLQLTLNNMNLLTSGNNAIVENMLSLTSGVAKGPGVFGFMGF